MAGRQDLSLSKRVVDRLSAGDKDEVFRNRDLPGLGLRVHPSGAKVFVFRANTPRSPG